MEAFWGAMISHVSEFGGIATPILIVALYKMMDNGNKVTKQAIDRLHDDVTVLKDNDLSILRSRLHDLTTDALLKGEVTVNEREAMDSLFDRYSALGGNSFIKTNMQMVHELPLKGAKK